ncbi:MAG: hypothetical protein PHY45_11670 [Rhodocyclaceae bacterium]|nr:hypothetical protein [Rhodocyclaceae bacterium]
MADGTADVVEMLLQLLRQQQLRLAGETLLLEHVDVLAIGRRQEVHRLVQLVGALGRIGEELDQLGRNLGDILLRRFRELAGDRRDVADGLRADAARRDERRDDVLALADGQRAGGRDLLGERPHGPARLSGEIVGRGQRRVHRLHFGDAVGIRLDQADRRAERGHRDRAEAEQSGSGQIDALGQHQEAARHAGDVAGDRLVAEHDQFAPRAGGG